jgi:hypothetical protein
MVGFYWLLQVARFRLQGTGCQVPVTRLAANSYQKSKQKSGNWKPVTGNWYPFRGHQLPEIEAKAR